MNTFLICLQGLSGSGKTTVAKYLASTLGVQAYHSDIERKKLFGLAPNDSSSNVVDNIYSAQATSQTFKQLHDLASNQLMTNRSVIVDAAFLKRSERQMMQKLAYEAEVRFLIISCQASDQEMYDRIKNRQRLGNDASEATEELIQKQKKWQEALTNEELKMCHKIFTEQKNWQDKLLQSIYHTIS